MNRQKKFRGDIPCQDCGTNDNPIWYTDNVFWNEVMDDHLVHNERNDKISGILCINCFTKRAEDKFDCTWRLIPEFEWKKSN